MYNLALDKNIIVSTVLMNNHINLHFRRQPVDRLLLQFEEICSKLHSIQLVDGLDKIFWRWTAFGIFSVKFLYNWLDYIGVNRYDFEIIR